MPTTTAQRSRSRITKSAQEPYCGCKVLFILSKWGLKTAMFSGRTIYGIAALHLVLADKLQHEAVPNLWLLPVGRVPSLGHGCDLAMGDMRRQQTH